VACTCPPGAQLFHRVVHRVGDGAGDVFGHRGLLRQVAFGHRLQFVHQPQNGRLVGVVDALGLLLLALGFAALGSASSGAARLVGQVQAQEADQPTSSAASDSSREEELAGRTAQRSSSAAACSRPLRSGSVR
jgi:hypothetical protein